MKNEVIQKNEGNQVQASDEILKATALIYFKDALVTQDYEKCPELIDIAKNFGASQGEIKEVIASYVKEARFVTWIGAKLKR